MSMFARVRHSTSLLPARDFGICGYAVVYVDSCVEAKHSFSTDSKADGGFSARLGTIFN